MRCASAVPVYVFPTSTTSVRTQVTMLSVNAETTNCPANSLVVMTQGELDQWTASPFRLTLAEGGAVSGAILLVWAVGFGIRAVLRTLMHADTPPSHD